MNNNPNNLIFSSWPSAGGSTAARLIVLTLNKKYIYAGGVLKRWADKMGYDSKTNAINDWAAKYHEHWDYVWENFILQKVRQSSNTVFEGMTAGFLLPDDVTNAYKIFIYANTKARLQRSKFDNRAEDIQKRDKFLQQEWLKRFGFDLFDLSTINSKYDFVLDTSNIGIKATAKTILEKLHTEKVISKGQFDKAQIKLDNLYTKYEKDSNVLMQEMLDKDLIQDSNELLSEIKTHYPELIKNIPEEMKKAMS